MKMGGIKDLTGMQFGRLTVIGFGEDHVRENGRRDYRWRCECECGNVVDVLPRNLLTGNTRSCGCGRKESRFKFTETEREAMDIPRPAEITIQDELVIGRKYSVDKEELELIEFYPYFARFRRSIGTTTSFQYWDLDKLQKSGRLKAV